jgi:hypothetical protein
VPHQSCSHSFLPIVVQYAHATSIVLVASMHLRRVGGFEGGYRREDHCGLKRRGWVVEMSPLCDAPSQALPYIQDLG